MLRLYMSVLLILGSISPLYGMDQENVVKKRKICPLSQDAIRTRASIYGILVGCDAGEEEGFYSEDIKRLKDRRLYLKKISFQEMELSPCFA